MDSVGVFHEGEIDGKPFHIFTLSSQISSSSSSCSGEAATDLDGDHLSLESPQQPLFLCPRLRGEMAHDDYYDEDDDDDDDDKFPRFNVPPHFPITKIDNAKICSKNPVLPIFWCNNKQPNWDEFHCGACWQKEMGTAYYICLGCPYKFHKECVESPLVIQNHPSYPFLSFHLYHHRRYDEKSCISCKLEIFGMFYHCPTDKLSLHPRCAMKAIPIHIDHPKRHSHILTFFPKQTSLRCDVCGLVEGSLPTYVCARCIFVVHQDCIYHPFVIRISRHRHRISFTYSLPSGKVWSCGVCRKKVDNHCGAYSCNKCGDYFVHSKCALRKDVWDGKELEGVPEEHEEILEPFEKIADGIILHFTHGHHLKLEVRNVYNEYKFCQACVLPIYEGNYYLCVDGCDFVLHEACASAPRKIYHPLHAHPLTLKAIPDYGTFVTFFRCNACDRISCGFVYEVGYYTIDVRCALVSEPFGYKGHEHPLFLSLDRTQEREATCRICRQTNKDTRKLSCIECNYVICFRCATLPYEARYKHDKHLLTFREGKEGSDEFDWCEVCERKVEYCTPKTYECAKEGYYECDKCCTTLHVHCLLGELPYLLKPGHVIKFHENEVHIISNNTQSRPLCYRCHHRCLQRVVFKWNDMTLCSYQCVHTTLYS